MVNNNSVSMLIMLLTLSSSCSRARTDETAKQQKSDRSTLNIIGGEIDNDEGVPVYNFNVDGQGIDEGGQTCTVTRIGERHILTATHCMKSINSQSGIGFYKNGKLITGGFSDYISWKDIGYDITILSINYAGNQRYPRENNPGRLLDNISTEQSSIAYVTSSPAISDSFLFYGYGWHEAPGLQRGTLISPLETTASNELLNELFRTSRRKTRLPYLPVVTSIFEIILNPLRALFGGRLLFAGHGSPKESTFSNSIPYRSDRPTIAQGDSGGALFNDDGKIVAIASGGTFKNIDSDCHEIDNGTMSQLQCQTETVFTGVFETIEPSFEPEIRDFIDTPHIDYIQSAKDQDIWKPQGGQIFRGKAAALSNSKPIEVFTNSLLYVTGYNIDKATLTLDNIPLPPATNCTPAGTPRTQTCEVAIPEAQDLPAGSLNGPALSLSAHLVSTTTGAQLHSAPSLQRVVITDPEMTMSVRLLAKQMTRSDNWCSDGNLYDASVSDFYWIVSINGKTVLIDNFDWVVSMPPQCGGIETSFSTLSNGAKWSFTTTERPAFWLPIMTYTRETEFAYSGDFKVNLSGTRCSGSWSGHAFDVTKAISCVPPSEGETCDLSAPSWIFNSTSELSVTDCSQELDRLHYASFRTFWLDESKTTYSSTLNLKTLLDQWKKLGPTPETVP